MSTIKPRSRYLIVTLTVLAVATLAAGSAWARLSMPGLAGHGWPNSALGCFQGSNAAAFNFCTGSSTQKFITPIEITSDNNNHTVRASFRGNGTTTVTQCFGFAVDGNNGSNVVGPALTTGTSFVTLNIGTVFVPSNGTLHVECDVAPSLTGGADGGAVRLVGEP